MKFANGENKIIEVEVVGKFENASKEPKQFYKVHDYRNPDVLLSHFNPIMNY